MNITRCHPDCWEIIPYMDSEVTKLSRVSFVKKKHLQKPCAFKRSSSRIISPGTELEPNMSLLFPTPPMGEKNINHIIRNGTYKMLEFFPITPQNINQPGTLVDLSRYVSLQKKPKKFNPPKNKCCSQSTHPEAAKNQSQAATKKHLRGDIGCEDEHFRIKSLYFNDIQYHLPFSTKQRTGFWDNGLRGLNIYRKQKSVPFWGTGLGGEILGGLQVALAKGLHPWTINILNIRSWSFA